MSKSTRVSAAEAALEKAIFELGAAHAVEHLDGVSPRKAGPKDGRGAHRARKTTSKRTPAPALEPTDRTDDVANSDAKPSCERQILEMLTSHPDGLARTRVIAGISVHPTQGYRMINRMLADGRIELLDGHILRLSPPSS